MSKGIDYSKWDNLVDSDDECTNTKRVVSDNNFAAADDDDDWVTQQLSNLKTTTNTAKDETVIQQWENDFAASMKEQSQKMNIQFSPAEISNLIGFGEICKQKLVEDSTHKSERGNNGEVRFGHVRKFPVAMKTNFQLSPTDWYAEMSFQYLLSKAISSNTAAIVPAVMGVWENVMYMEWFEGTELQSQNSVSRDQFKSLLEYLQFTSHFQIQHGDLHAANVLVRDQSIAVIDYGLCSNCRKARCEEHGNDIDFVKELLVLSMVRDVNESESTHICTIIDSVMGKYSATMGSAPEINWTPIYFRCRQVLESDPTLLTLTLPNSVIKLVKYSQLRLMLGLGTPTVNNSDSNGDYSKDSSGSDCGSDSGSDSAEEDILLTRVLVVSDKGSIASAWDLLGVQSDHYMLDVGVTFAMLHKGRPKLICHGSRTAQPPFYFYQDFRNRELILLIETPNVHYSDLFIDVGPGGDDIPWAKIKVTGNSTVIHVFQLSFVLDPNLDKSSIADVIVNDKKYFVLTLKVHPAICSEYIPSPFLSSFCTNMNVVRESVRQFKLANGTEI